MHLRRVRFRDVEARKTLVFLTNQMALPAPTICGLYPSRWQVELFCKWIKQNPRIKLEIPLYTLLQVISVTIFEKIPLQSTLSLENDTSTDDASHNQSNLFKF